MSFDKLYYKGKEVKEYRGKHNIKPTIIGGNKIKTNLWMKLSASKNTQRKSKRT